LLPELNQLINLQELDKVILEINRQLQYLPQQLLTQTQELEAYQAEQAAHLQELENLQRQRRELEAEILDMEEAIKKSRQRLMEIKSNLEYRAMLKEIGFKEDQRDQKETRILEIMELIEAQNQELATVQEKTATLTEIIGRQKEENAIQTQALQQQLASLQQQRLILRQDLPNLLLRRYEFIRQRHNSTTIAEVKDGVCLGCHLNILPQQYIDLQKGEEILQCPHCQRILFWLGEVESEAESANLSRKVS
jgi:predicted  nucleic acid-binding Zn-ribbon protein